MHVRLAGRRDISLFLEGILDVVKELWLRSVVLVRRCREILGACLSIWAFGLVRFRLREFLVICSTCRSGRSILATRALGRQTVAQSRGTLRFGE